MPTTTDQKEPTTMRIRIFLDEIHDDRATDVVAVVVADPENPRYQVFHATTDELPMELTRKPIESPLAGVSGLLLQAPKGVRVMERIDRARHLLDRAAATGRAPRPNVIAQTVSEVLTAAGVTVLHGDGAHPFRVEVEDAPEWRSPSAWAKVEVGTVAAVGDQVGEIAEVEPDQRRGTLRVEDGEEVEFTRLADVRLAPAEVVSEAPAESAVELAEKVFAPVVEDDADDA